MGCKVFVNGCFDLLHLGHIELLNKAKEYGDYLIVGINSNSSIKNLKGPSRPIFNSQYRKKMLLALDSVDEVMIFSEANALNLIKKIKPDIYVKGRDYKNKKTPETDFLLKLNKKIIYVDFHKNYSSTNIIAKIIKKNGKA